MKCLPVQSQSMHLFMLPCNEPVICPTGPVTTPEILPELPVGSGSLVTAQRPTFEPITLPILSPETVKASHVFHINSVTAIETIHELSCPILVNEPDFELSTCHISVCELVYELPTRSTVNRGFIEEPFGSPA